jgi:hypothetical protein
MPTDRAAHFRFADTGLLRAIRKYSVQADAVPNAPTMELPERPAGHRRGSQPRLRSAGLNVMPHRGEAHHLAERLSNSLLRISEWSLHSRSR